MPRAPKALAPGAERKHSRKSQILQTLAHMLEATPGGRITTAALAREVGVSEAALYRHFPSKTRMFEAVIDFIESRCFDEFDAITQEQAGGVPQCQQVCHALLMHCQRHPGVARILVGDAIAGEDERLRDHIQAFFTRLQSLLRHIIQDGIQQGQLKCRVSDADSVHLIMTVLEGRLCRFVRSGFRHLPTEQWELQWTLVTHSLFMSGGTRN